MWEEGKEERKILRRFSHRHARSAHIIFFSTLCTAFERSSPTFVLKAVRKVRKEND